MTPNLREELISLARQNQTQDDPSHDFQHVLRVFNVAERIATIEKADLDVVIPAALFHDVVVFRKTDSRSSQETDLSAEYVYRILRVSREFPDGKIGLVQQCIRECSYSKGLPPSSLESAILQDADRLEATGVISIMRTFASCGLLNLPFYPDEDPLCKNGSVLKRSGVDLFYSRLLLVEKQMNTNRGKFMARQRTNFLKQFLHELQIELAESGIVERSELI